MYICNGVYHTILLQALCIILCGGGIPCIAVGWVKSSSQGCQFYHPSANLGLKVSEERSQLRNPIITHIRALCINAFVRIQPWKTSFSTRAALIFGSTNISTQGTILLLIWPMSKQEIKDLMEISISWRPNRFIRCLSMKMSLKLSRTNYGQRCKWFVLLWQNHYYITAPPDKDTPQLCIT